MLKKTILVVDDEEIIRELLKHILVDSGYQVIEAVNGDDCVEVARNSPPDLIILDMHMPKMIGLEVAPILRSHSATKFIPIIALTADTSTESIEAVHGAGCNHYLTKPVQRDKLVKTVERLIAST